MNIFSNELYELIALNHSTGEVISIATAGSIYDLSIEVPLSVTGGDNALQHADIQAQPHGRWEVILYLINHATGTRKRLEDDPRIYREDIHLEHPLFMQ